MRPSKFSEAEVAAILLERESGVHVAELCRKHGISSATFYKWRARYGSLDSSGIVLLRRLERENKSLRQLLATALAENVAYKDAETGKADS